MNDPAGRRRLTAEESKRLIAEYAPLVNAIARSLLKKLPPSVESDDLVQDGFLGLLAALLYSTKARASQHFQNYISQRVRGAMLDGLRKLDHGSRNVREDMRRVEQAIHQLSQQLGRPPSEGEIATALSMPLPTYQRLLMNADGYTLLSLEDFDEQDLDRSFIDWCADTHSDPLSALERAEVQRSLLVAISDLSDREEQVLSMHYRDELRSKDIAQRLGVTEGRVSQIRTQAIAKLRAVLANGDKGRSLLAPRWRLS